MSSSREAILARIRAAKPSATLAPGQSSGPYAPPPEGGALVAQFIERACDEAASVARLSADASVAEAVRDYLQGQGLSNQLVVAPNLAGLDWSCLDARSGPVAPDGDAVCTGCYAAIAEAGALVVTSQAGHPTEFNFLAATHIVILSAASILPSFEHLWAKLDADGIASSMPRMMNFIVGPSRTADLGVPSKLGAHGPARLHILLVEQEVS